MSGFEMMAKLINPILQVIKILRDLGNWIKGQINKYDFFGKKTKKYRRKLEKHYNNFFRVLGTEKFMSLLNMLVRVNIWEEIPERQRKTIGELNQQFNASNMNIRYELVH